ncbi:MAG TPA: hypothetical protein VKK61_05125 [Tepidisphaeraceae bacterium]|nr:hypothetical protein [Tepidisphaeraceae bacterium]
MSAIYNPEANIIARIEALEFKVREIRRKIEHAHNEADRRVLNKQIDELRDEIAFLTKRLDKQL